MIRTPSSEPLRQAVASRLHEVVDSLARTMDASTIEEVLGIADPLSGLGVALERATTQKAGLRDPLAGARARAVGSRERLIEKAGGVIRLAEAAARLGVSPQAITGRRTRGTILAVPMPNGEWVYPGCQFTGEGLVPGLGQVLQAFNQVSPWGQLAVLVAPSDCYGGRSAFDLLESGELEAARTIAATYGEQG